MTNSSTDQGHAAQISAIEESCNRHQVGYDRVEFDRTADGADHFVVTTTELSTPAAQASVIDDVLGSGTGATVVTFAVVENAEPSSESDNL